ncbi:MAG: c-type cytochrome [Verrucomicrobiota bacterium]
MDIAMAAIQFKKEKQLNTLLADLDEDAIWEMSRDPVAVSAGQAHFNQFCAVCHAADLSATLNGTPLPGVALNDSQWKYCRKPTDVFNIITKGSPDVTKGMVAWDAILGPKKIAETTAFVLSHHDADSPWEPTADSPEGLDFTTPASTPETTPTPAPASKP